MKFFHENFTEDVFFYCASHGMIGFGKLNREHIYISILEGKNHQNLYEKLMYALKNIVSHTESFLEIFKKFRKS